MILWLYIFLIVTVNAGNYKFEYTNEDWVQSAGGKGQYVSIGDEPTVIQWVIPPGKELAISDAVEFPDFGISSGEFEVVYHYVFPESEGPDLEVLTNGVDSITLYRQSNPPVVSAVSAVCPNDPGYLEAHRKWLRKFSRIRGRKLLSSDDGTIHLNANMWGEPHFNDESYYIEHDSDDDMVINLKHASPLTDHKLIDPEGNLHRQLEPGILNIIKAPHKPGNYTIEASHVWGEYKKPIIHVGRRLHSFGIHGHPIVKLRAGETWATVCPATAQQYGYTVGTASDSGCGNPNGGWPSGAHTKTTTGACVTTTAASGKDCNTPYAIEGKCTYTWKIDYTENTAECGTTTQSVTQANADECGTTCTEYKTCCCHVAQCVYVYCDAGNICNEGAYGSGGCDSGYWPCYQNSACASCGCKTETANTCTYDVTVAASCTKDYSAEVTGTHTITTTSCPVNCVGSFGSWSSCSGTGGGTKFRTYSITTQPAHGGTGCPHDDGHVENLNCVTTGPTTANLQKDGSDDSNGIPTSKLDVQITTAQVESITCAALDDGATPTVAAITGATLKGTATTNAGSNTDISISGLIDETSYDIYCAIGSATTAKADVTTSDWFVDTSTPTISDLDATTAKCSAAWSDSASARCVALATSDTCSWSAIENLPVSGTAPATLTTADLTASTWSFTNLNAATEYQCCCYSSHFDGTDTESDGASVTFKTLGFTSDMSIDSVTQTSVSFTFAVLNIDSTVTCTAYTTAQWNAGKQANSGTKSTSSPQLATSVSTSIDSLKHATEYYVECEQGTDSTSASDTTNPPQYSSQPAASSHTITGFVVKTTIDRAEKIVCSAYAKDTTAPTEAVIVTGTDALATSGQVDIAADTEKSLQLSGLTFGTTYDVYCALVGDTDTGGAHTKSNKLQTATVQPSITSGPTLGDLTFEMMKIKVTYDHDKAARCIVVAADSTAPTLAEFTAATADDTLAFASGDATADTELELTLTPGCCGTAYDVYCGQPEYNVMSSGFRVTTIQPTIAQPIVITESTDRIKFSVVFDHINAAACILVPRDATALKLLTYLVAKEL